MNRRARVVLLAFLFATALGLLNFAYHYLDAVSRQRQESWQTPFIEEVTGCFGFVALIPVIVWAARRFRLDIPGGWRNLPMHFVILIAASITHTSFNWGSRLLIFWMAGLGHYDYGLMRVRYFMEFPIDVINYSIIVVLTIFYDRQIRAAQLEKTLAQAQLRNLRLQLQPHFLFNTLNTISSVMYENVQVADRMIARLSDLLRMTLEQGDAQEVTLEREIEFLRLYVETMKARFEEKLEVNVDASPETRRALVPPLVLQPLVENSIKHGADYLTSKVHVEVRAARENGTLRLEVRDHGPGLANKDPLGTGIGLSNTAERLQRLYGRTQHLDLRNAEDGGLVVTVEVPFHVDPQQFYKNLTG